MADRTVRVILTADTSGYDRKMQQAQQTTSKWQTAAAASAKAVAAGLVAAAAAGGALLTGLVATGVAYNTLQQTSRAALTTLLGGAKAANEQMDKLDAFAKTSPFAKQVFITAQQQLIGFGLSASKVIPYLTSIQDATAAIGGSGDTVAAIAGQIAGVVSGGFSGDFFNSLGSQGIDAAKIMGEQLQMSAQQVRSSIESGTLGTTRALDALIAGMEKRFGGAAANVKQTWAGATDRIKAAWRDVGAAIVEPFVGHKGGGDAVAWANKFADVLRAVEKKVGPTIDHILEKFDEVGGGGFGDFLDNVITKIQEFDPSSLDEGLDLAVQLLKDARDIGAQLLPIFGTVATTAGTMFGAAVQAAEPFLRAIAAVLKLFNSMPDAFKNLVAGGLILGMLAGQFSFLGAAITRTAVQTTGLIAEMRVLYAQANANGIALTRMGAAAAVAGGRMSMMSAGSKVAGVAAAGVAAYMVLQTANDKFMDWVGAVPAGADAAAKGLQEIARAGKVTDETFQSLGAKSGNLKNSLHDIFDRSWLDNLAVAPRQIENLVGLSALSDDAVDEGRRFFQSIDDGLSKLVADGNSLQAKNAFKVISDEAAKQGVSVGQLMKQLPHYTAGLDLVAQQEKAAADNAKAAGTAIDGLGDKAGLTTDELNGLAAAAAKSAGDAFNGQTSVLTSWSASSYESALQQVASAQEAVASSGRSMARQQRDSAESMAEAQKQIVDAQAAELKAQEGLNKARADAVRNLRELQEAVVDTALDERSATIALQRAKLSLLDTEGSRHSSALDQEEAVIGVAQAERRLQEAQEARADASVAANDAQRRGIAGSEAVVAAQQDIADAAKAVGDAQKAAAKQAQSAMEQQADASRSYAQAQQQLAEAQSAAYKASLKGTFEETLRTAKSFTDGIVELTRRGLDPSLVAQLLQAGPQQAAPVIEQMLSDHSGRLIQMANEAKGQFDAMSTQIAEITRLTNLATNSQSDQMTKDLSTAMQLAQLIAHDGGARTSQQLAAQLGVGVSTVDRIRKEFGIGLSIPVSAPGLAGAVQAFGQLSANIQAAVQQGGALNGTALGTIFGPPQTGTDNSFPYLVNSAVPRADGGEIFGVGGPRDDKNLVWASRGEFMVNAKGYSANRDIVQAINAGQKFQRLAGGGEVGGSRPLVNRTDVSRTVPAPPSAGVDNRAIAKAVADAMSGWRMQMDQRGLVRMVREQNQRDGLLGVVGGR